MGFSTRDYECEVCGFEGPSEPSEPLGDALCPQCNGLRWPRNAHTQEPEALPQTPVQQEGVQSNTFAQISTSESEKCDRSRHIVAYVLVGSLVLLIGVIVALSIVGQDNEQSGTTPTGVWSSLDGLKVSLDKLDKHSLDEQHRLETERAKKRQKFMDAWSAIKPDMSADEVGRLLRDGPTTGSEQWEPIPSRRQQQVRLLSKALLAPDTQRTWHLKESVGMWSYTVCCWNGVVVGKYLSGQISCPHCQMVNPIIGVRSRDSLPCLHCGELLVDDNDEGAKGK